MLKRKKQQQKTVFSPIKHNNVTTQRGIRNPEHLQHTEKKKQSLKEKVFTESVFQLVDGLEEEENFSWTAQVKNLAPKPFS